MPPRSNQPDGVFPEAGEHNDDEAVAGFPPPNDEHVSEQAQHPGAMHFRGRLREEPGGISRYALRRMFIGRVLSYRITPPQLEYEDAGQQESGRPAGSQWQRENG